MNIREIAANIAEKYGVDGLESKDGKIELKIDGAAVMIEETDGDVFIFNGIIGDAPSDGAETFAQILLESNLVMMNSRAVALAHNADTQAYVLIERVRFAHASDFESFCQCLAKFVDTLETWRKTLTDFSPSAAAAAAISARKEADTQDVLRFEALRC